MILIPRLVLTIILFCICSFLGVLCTLMRPFHPNNCNIVGGLLGNTILPVLGIHHRIFNRDRLDKYRPCVFVSNHQDSLDVFSFGKIVPKRTVSLGKKSIKYIPFFGQFYWLAGNILIDRKNTRKAVSTMGEAAEAITKRDTSVWIMPEGTRSKGRGVMPFKKGAFFTAIQAQCPVVPVAVSSNYLNVNLSKFKAGHIWFRILPAIETKGLKSSDAGALAMKCHDLVKAEVAKLDQEIAQFKGDENV